MMDTDKESERLCICLVDPFEALSAALFMGYEWLDEHDSLSIPFVLGVFILELVEIGMVLLMDLGVITILLAVGSLSQMIGLAVFTFPLVVSLLSQILNSG